MVCEEFYNSFIGRYRRRHADLDRIYDEPEGSTVPATPMSSQVKNYSPVYMKQNAAKNTGPAHGVGGLCECMRCSSSWKAAWAECTCAGAAR